MLRRILEWLWNLHGLTCQEAVRLAARALDRRVTVRERLQLSFHSLLCRYCRNYRRQLCWLRRWTRRLAVANGSSGLPAGVAAQIKKRLTSELSRPN
jgi:hypothetical protein